MHRRCCPCRSPHLSWTGTPADRQGRSGRRGPSAMGDPSPALPSSHQPLTLWALTLPLASTGGRGGSSPALPSTSHPAPAPSSSVWLPRPLQTGPLTKDIVPSCNRPTPPDPSEPSSDALSRASSPFPRSRTPLGPSPDPRRRGGAEAGPGGTAGPRGGRRVPGAEAGRSGGAQL